MGIHGITSTGFNFNEINNSSEMSSAMSSSLSIVQHICTEESPLPDLISLRFITTGGTFYLVCKNNRGRLEKTTSIIKSRNNSYLCYALYNLFILVIVNIWYFNRLSFILLFYYLFSVYYFELFQVYFLFYSCIIFLILFSILFLFLFFIFGVVLFL